VESTVLPEVVVSVIDKKQREEDSEIQEAIRIKMHIDSNSPSRQALNYEFFSICAFTILKYISVKKCLQQEI